MACAAEDWSALAKIADGQFNIAREHLRRLFYLGLVERQCGILRLSAQGRSVLGLPDE